MTHQMRARRTPGTKPAVNCLATEEPMATLRLTMGTLGGIRMPSVPPAQTMPQANFLG